MTHEQLREALRKIAEHPVAYKQVPGLTAATDFSLWSHYWTVIGEMKRAAREALAALDREGAGETYDANLSDLIHYPLHWDTAAYPTFADALREIGCSQCNGLPPPGIHRDATPPAAEREDTMRIALEQIAVKDADDPQATAEGALVDAGYWTDKAKPAAERDVSGWAPELREIAAAIPQSVHDEVAREAAAEREGQP